MVKKNFHHTSMYLSPAEGTSEWYIGTHFEEDICDLYEAEERIEFRGNFPGNQLFFLHYPDGAVHTPFEIRENVYYEEPKWDNGCFGILEVDFSSETIRLYTYVPGGKAEILVTLPLSAVKDCYNLKLDVSPWTISRQTDDVYEIIWPEKKSFALGKNGGMLYRNGSILYFSRWAEEPYYKDRVVTIDIESGKEIAAEEGSLYRMPDGTLWNV